MKTIRVNTDVQHEVIYHHDCTLQEFLDKYGETFVGEAKGLCIRREGDNPVIWAKDNDVYTIIHESLHAVFHIADNIGIKHCEQSEEWFCYLQEKIVKSILSILEKRSGKP